MFIPINKIKIYLITFFSASILFYSPIIFLYYKNYNISLFQIGIIFSISSITTIITEIPFGIFSDKNSPKTSIIIGYFISLIGMSLMIISNNFTLFIFSTILLAIGEAGVSGANIVLLMTLLEDKDDFFDISTVSRNTANILGGLLIGSMFKYNMKLPFFISSILIIINLFLYFTIKNNTSNINEKDMPEKHNNVSFIQTIKNNLFILIILFFSYISVPQIMVYFPEYLSLNNFSPENIGIMYMLANFTSLIGSKIHKNYMKNIKIPSKLKFSLFFIFICSFFMWYTQNVFLFLFFYFIFRIITGWFFQLFSIYINNQTSLKYKATLFSISNVVMECAFIVSDPFITFIISKSNIKISYLFTSIVVLIIIILIIINDFFLLRNNKI